MTQRFTTSFSETPYARLIDERMADPATIARIVALSKQGQPAIAALDDAFHSAFGMLADGDKKAAGRHLKERLSRHGLRPVRKGQRVAGGKVFRNGSVYGFDADRHPPLPLRHEPSADDRVDAATAILAAGRFGDAGTVDDFIAERRAEAARENAE